MLNKLMGLNLSLLIVHQVDAAYWHEWEMFGIPGGIQVFDLCNLAIFVLLLGLMVPVIERRRGGFAASLAIAAACGVVLPIHAGFALAGFTQFSLPVSAAAIVACFLGALAQAIVTLRSRAQFAR